MNTDLSSQFRIHQHVVSYVLRGKDHMRLFQKYGWKKRLGNVFSAESANCHRFVEGDVVGRGVFSAGSGFSARHVYGVDFDSH